MSRFFASLRSTSFIQRLFISFFLVGFVFNIVFDIFAYTRVDGSAAAGQHLAYTYEILNHMRNLDDAIDQLAMKDQSALPIVAQELEFLRKKVKGPEVQALLAQIPLQIGKKESVETVSKMIRLESGQLEARTKRVILEDEKYEAMLSGILFVDCLLLATMFVFFIMALREKKMAELNFMASLNTIRETNASLEAEIIRRQRAMRMTVHDLKNPLGTIQGFANLIAEDHANTSIHEYSETIKRITKSSLVLVDTILNSPTAPVRFKKIDLIETLKEVYQENKVMAEAKQQSFLFKTETPAATVFANSAKMSELLTNLVSNAIKYTPRNGKIWIRCSRTKNSYRIEIEDQGLGFSGEDKERAFQYGERLSAQPTANESSTGIGLYIARQITKMHKGTLQILDNPSGVGACLRLELPMIDAAQEVHSLDIE